MNFKPNLRNTKKYIVFEFNVKFISVSLWYYSNEGKTIAQQCFEKILIISLVHNFYDQ